MQREYQRIYLKILRIYEPSLLIKSGYPRNFINSTIQSFQDKISQDPLIPHFLFEERTRITVKLPYCERNEKTSFSFLNRLNSFTQHRYKIEIIWQTDEKLRLCLS